MPRIYRPNDLYCSTFNRQIQLITNPEPFTLSRETRISEEKSVFEDYTNKIVFTQRVSIKGESP